MSDKLQDLRESLDQMKLKKVMFGGYDKKDVQMKLEMALAMFQKCMKDQEDKEKDMARAYEKKIRELNKTIVGLTDENQAMVQEQYKMKESYKAYCGEIIKQYSESLCSLSGEFSRILENVSNLQKEISEESIIEGLEKALETEEVEVE